MANKVTVPIAVAGAVAAVVVVLGAIFLFAGGPDDDQAGPAPTTRLTFPDTNPSSGEPTPDSPHRPVPEEQVDGIVVPAARTEGRTLYIPAQDGDCVREQVWPRGEHPDRVEVEIRSLPVPMPTGLTTGADGTASYGCLGDTGQDVPYAVIDLAEPLGDRRLVVKHVHPPVPR